MATDTSEGVAVLNYLGVMLRWKWVIAVVTLACLGAAVAYLMTATPRYEATASCSTSSR